MSLLCFCIHKGELFVIQLQKTPVLKGWLGRKWKMVVVLVYWRVGMHFQEISFVLPEFLCAQKKKFKAFSIQNQRNQNDVFVWHL